MFNVNEWIELTKNAFLDLGQGSINFIPKLIGAIVLFIIGWIVAWAVEQVVVKVLDLLKVNQLFARGKVDDILEKAGIKANVTAFVGNIVKWIVVLAFLVVAANILGLEPFAVFLGAILAYLPNVVIAALILVATVIIVDIAEKVIVAALSKLGPSHSHLVGAIVRWAIWIFAILAILNQLKFGPAEWGFELIKIAFIGLVAMAAIAFGLGGKEIAAEILRDARNKLKG